MSGRCKTLLRRVTAVRLPASSLANGFFARSTGDFSGCSWQSGIRSQPSAGAGCALLWFRADTS